MLSNFVTISFNLFKFKFYAVGFGIRKKLFWIPDPWGQKGPEPGFVYATLLRHTGTLMCLFHNIFSVSMLL
jgi:hypothetical protein